MNPTTFEAELTLRLRHVAATSPTEPTRALDTDRPTLGGPEPGPAHGSHRRAQLIGAALLVITAVAVGGFLAARHDDGIGVVVDTPSTEAPETERPPPTIAPNLPPVTAGLLPDTTARMPTAPIDGRIGPAAVWTGAEMVVWGGSKPRRAGGEDPFDDGAAFDPRLNTWRTIAAAPIEGRAYAAVVWTGIEMIVWGGSSNGDFLDDGAAYNPVADTWRTISDAPKPGATKSAVVWTGTEMLVTGGLNQEGTSAAYDPARDEWRRTAPAPGKVLTPYPTVVWTGTEAIHVLTPAGIGNSSRLVAYHPDTDSWEELVDAPPDLSVGRQLVWTGDQVLGTSTSVGTDQLLYQPSSGDSTAIPGLPAGSPPFLAAMLTWSGTEALMWGGGSTGMAFNPTTQQWRTFPAGDGPFRVDGAAVWADGVLLAWGGFLFDDGSGGPGGAGDGIIYRPA